MENNEEVMNETLNSGGDTVVVKTTTVVERTKITIVENENIREEKKDDLFGGDEGDDMKVDLGENGGNIPVENEGFFNGGEVERLFEGNEGYLADENDEKVPADPMDVFDFKEDTEKKDEEMVENGEQIEGEGEDDDEEEEDHDFVVGDFVWGKVKSFPSWPGQIYDPSDASEYAATIKRKGHLLVAYFGDGSFSWCKPSQLKPFIDDFQEMSNKSDSKYFVNAVKKALEQVSSLVKAELMCKCQPGCQTENVDEVNSGIKKGVPVPKGNTIKVLIDRMHPVELLSTLKSIAIMDDTIFAELELTVLKSWISAFYGQKGGYLLPEYHDPEYIEGLEDESKSDNNGGFESTENGDEKLSHRRKKKSVAELLGEEEPKVKKAKTSKDGGSGKGKRKGLVVSVTAESDHESGGFEDETMSPRQRKRSKYLSPPYLSPASGKLSALGSGSFKEPKADTEEVPETADEQVEEPLKKSTGRRGRPKKQAKEGSDLKDSKENKTIDASVNVDNLFQGLLRAALDPSSFVEKNLPAITEFISSFRKSTFEDESNGQAVEKKGSSAGTRKAAVEDMSDLAIIKEKLEAMRKTVQTCGEQDIKEDIKAYLEGEISEVLEKVGTLRGV